jgi:hypothetical protein
MQLLCHPEPELLIDIDISDRFNLYPYINTTLHLLPREIDRPVRLQ